MTALREILAAKGGDPERRKEAEAMLACLERYVRRQIVKAEQDAEGPVEQAKVFRALATAFKGDRFGEDARARLRALVSDPGFAAERKAHDKLVKARAAFRRLPRAGTYTYDMTYRPIKARAHVAKRRKMIAAFRLTLMWITRKYPGTDAASRAEDLLIEHEVPEMGEEEARTRLNEAVKRLQEARRPCALYDGFVELYAVVEGYYGDDATAERAAGLLESVSDERKGALEQAMLAYERLNDEAGRIVDAVRDGGAVLPRARARAYIADLNRIAEEAGTASRLAEEIRQFAADLEESYEGPASLGVALARQYDGPGVCIAWINPRSAAHQHGLRRGDVILRFGDREIEGVAGLRDALAERKPGQTVKLRIRRGPGDETAGSPLTLSVTLGRKL
jgi:hypothetical protein